MDAANEQVAGYSIELPEFEGPLDLLLHLVKKHELSIVDIPIKFITEQYLKMLDLMHVLQLDVAGEYLLMAATLCHLKSRELVPPDPAELAADAEADSAFENEIDPRQELIRRLLEYQKYKDAAAALGERPVAGRNVWHRGSRMEDVIGLHVLPGGAPLAEVPVFQLIESLERVLSRAKVTTTHDVVVDRLSITDRINELIDRLEREGTFTFESCFEFLERGGSMGQLRHAVVVTFLAILEMTRLKLVRLAQPQVEAQRDDQPAEGQRGQIYVTRATADLRAQADAIAKKGEKAGKNGHHVVDDSDSTNKIAVPERPSDRDDDAEEELLRDARTRFADDGSLIAGDADDDATQELDEDNPTRALDADAIDELERDRATRMGADVLRALETDEKEDDADPFESRFDFSTGTRHPALNEDEPSTAELEPPDPGSADAASPRLQSIVESVLFAADRPLNLRQLADLVEEPEVERIRAAVLAVEQSWRERGVQLHEVAGGYQFRTHPANAGWVQKLLQQKPVRLSRALLETLAIVSYRQPITRPEIDEIRGVDSGGTLKTLMDRSLVRILGKREEVGRPLLYGTTKEFLEFFSLRDLKDLPTLREFHELSEEHEAQVAALEEAAPAGSIVAEGEDDETEALPRLSRLEIAQPKEDAAELAEIDRLIRTAGASIVTDSDLHAERDAAVDPHNDAANDTAEERVVTSRFAPVREEVSEFDEERMRTMQFGEPLPSPATHQGEEDEDFEQDEATRLRGGLDAELVDRRDPDKEPQ